jgi:hypothetical protein
VTAIHKTIGGIGSFALLLCVCTPLASQGQEMIDPGFESVPVGALASTGKMDNGWEVQRTGRDEIKDNLRVQVIDDTKQSHAGAKCVELTIPADTEGFEFVTIGQRLSLKAETEYEASVWVRWSNPSSDETSNAIVSFWIRDRDGKGHFSGRDVWLRDRKWTNIKFRFRPTDVSEKSLLYVSLLPNQKPTQTTLLVDDFTIHSTDDLSATKTETRIGNMIVSPNFETTQSALDPPWYFTNLNGKSIQGELIDNERGNHFHITMPKATGNFESAQLWQHLHLVEGQRYRINGKIRWDNFSPKAKSPIVNFGIYKKKTNTWYGPVDQILNRTGEFENYTFDHIATETGPWKIYTQLNGWGNFGSRVSITIQEVTCTVVP